MKIKIGISICIILALVWVMTTNVKAYYLEPDIEEVYSLLLDVSRKLDSVSFELSQVRDEVSKIYYNTR